MTLPMSGQALTGLPPTCSKTWVAVAVPGFLAEAATEKAPEKAKAEKTKGDVGLIDMEKNYMILVTKEGKLVTLDFDQKTKVTELKASDAKMADIGLGSSASVEYTKKGDKNILSKIEF